MGLRTLAEEAGGPFLLWNEYARRRGNFSQANPRCEGRRNANMVSPQRRGFPGSLMVIRGEQGHLARPSIEAAAWAAETRWSREQTAPPHSGVEEFQI